MKGKRLRQRQKFQRETEDADDGEKKTIFILKKRNGNLIY